MPILGNSVGMLIVFSLELIDLCRVHLARRDLLIVLRFNALVLSLRSSFHR